MGAFPPLCIPPPPHFIVIIPFRNAQINMMNTINSIKDPHIILAREVSSLKGRSQHHKMLLEGEQIIDWALEHGLEIEFLLYAPGGKEIPIDKYQQHNIEIFRVSDGIQKKVTGRSYPVPLTAVARLPVSDRGASPDFVVVLDDVRDFGNLGTIVRTCSAFGIGQIISLTMDGDLYQKKTIEASRGSVFSVNSLQFEGSSRTIAYLWKQGFQIVATSPRGSRLQSMLKLQPGPTALVIGNETSGVSREFEEQADYLIQIPMADEMESLNVGVAAGISIYELRIKQVISMMEERIKTTLGREMNVAAMLIQQAVDAELQKVTEYSSKQVVFLMVLRCDRHMSVDHMCRQFGLLPEETADFLAPMLESGLIRREEMLELTSRGEEVIAKLWTPLENAEKRVLEGFTEAEIRQLKQQLHRIQENCAQIISGS